MERDRERERGVAKASLAKVFFSALLRVRGRTGEHKFSMNGLATHA